MKLLKIRLKGITIFENDEFEFNFTAQKRVIESELGFEVFEVNNISRKLNVLCLAGKNSAGKTVSLSILSSILQLYLRNISFPKKNDRINYQEIVHQNVSELFSDTMEIETFWGGKNCYIYALTNMEIEESSYRITEERIYKIKESLIRSKKNVFNADFYVQNEIEHSFRSEIPSLEYLSKDRSILYTFLKEQETREIFILDNLQNVNFNFAHGFQFLPKPIIQKLLPILDTNIEYLEVDKKDINMVKLKFYEKEEVVIKIHSLQAFLSSGTIRMLNLITSVFTVCLSGGYIFIDEIETHLDRGLIEMLIKLFESPRFNKFGATLVFSTHYAELLDLIYRSDAIYILDKQKGKSMMQRYSQYVTRSSNDMKKSLRYLSGDLGLGVHQKQVNEFLSMFHEGLKHNER